MTTNNMREVHVEGRDIQKFIFEKLGPACQGEKLPNAVLGMITFSILLQKPDIAVEALQEAVMSTAQHMVMHLALDGAGPESIQ